VNRVTSSDVKDDADKRWYDLGEFIREQRNVGQMSLRKLSELAGVSNPYLSQIERGLRRPSAEILQQLAKALRISAEQLYVQAGLLEERGTSQAVEAALVSDVAITERQKRVLLDIYASFLVENEALAAAADLAEPTPVTSAPAKKATKRAAKKTTKKTTQQTTKRAAKKATKKAAKTSAGTTAKRTTSKSPAKKATRTAAPRSTS
jgi:transcriptional regulator with XRE-family HTH domain